MGYRCFLIAPTGTCHRWLRRYRLGADDVCPVRGEGGCGAMVRIEDGPVVEHRDADGRLDHYTTAPLDWPRDDPRWPVACAECGRPLGDEFEHQLFYERAYRLPDGGDCTLRDAPVGAIWRAEWHEGHWRGADGRCYGVQLPPGGIGDQWIIEQPSVSGGGWTRTGEPPLFTCSPSILTPRYHGFLTAGVLTDDLDGRRYGDG